MTATPPGFVTRFAPSPTGYLHLGHALSARVAFDAASKARGQFRLRIEDIDHTRCRPEYEAAIFEDLIWLGMNWDGEMMRQSERGVAYEAALDALLKRGVLYRCFRTRQEVALAMLSAPHGPQAAFIGAPLDPDHERARLAAGEPFAWRLSLACAADILGQTFDPELEAGGDVVLARKDVGVAYHLASVVDDAAQGITHVIRGEDLASAVPVQRLLQDLLDLPPVTYQHHALLLGPDGKRLAKRNGGTALRDLRASGAAPDDIWRMAGFAGAV